jgi:hypothetical protein
MEMAEFEVNPGKFADAAAWVMDRIQTREVSRLAPEVPVGPEVENVADFPKTPPPLTKLYMGHLAFAEAQLSHKDLSIRAVGYCDGVGPRVRIGPLVAEPTDALPPWVIRVQ